MAQCWQTPRLSFLRLFGFWLCLNDWYALVSMTIMENDSSPPTMPESTDDPWQDLILSMLAVNGYSLEKAFGLADKFREQDLFDPKSLTSARDIAVRLNAAGYVRGIGMTKIF